MGKSSLNKEQKGGSPLTVLTLVEDADEFASIKKMLNGATRYEFNIQKPGKSADVGETIERDPPDTILITVDFAEKSALRVLKQVRARNAAPAVIIASNGDEIWAVRTLKEGAVDYLPKAGLSDHSLAEALIDAKERWLVKKEAEEQHAELAYQAIYDGLTEVFARRAIMKQIEVEIARAERYARPLTLIMGDIDKFKRVNDTYGHIIGDVILKKFATTLTNNTRRSDFVGRYGGEEFLVLLPESPLSLGVHIGEKLRKHCAKIEIPNSKPTERITASFGVCEYTGDMTLEDFVRSTDEMMYSAKQNGRNQVQPAPK